MGSLLGVLSRRHLDAPPLSIAPAAPDAGQDARAALREAQGRAAETASAAQQARWMLERAAGHVSACCAALDAFRDLDGRVAEAGKAALLAGEATGRAAMPADLVAARADRAAALEDHGDALATAALLEADAGAAAAADALAQTELRAAADAVAQIVALGMVAELRATELAAGEQRILLIGLANSRTAADIPLTWPILQTMQDPHHAMMVALVGAAAGPAWRDAGRRWDAFKVALALDADAVLPA